MEDWQKQILKMTETEPVPSLFKVKNTTKMNQKQIIMENQKITIKTSEIKKGDIVIIRPNEYREPAESDAYKHNGVWSFDFSNEPFSNETYRYGFQCIDTDIEVIRKF
tara:strand:- start:95 stop:418 length:324 start_codon:yes stop_codon:yes gene_type:complete